MKPFTVRLNFHRDLDFFLGSRTQGRSVERTLHEKTSVKDVIESCGVPHPEVDLILVNGEAVGFNFGVTDATEIEVYPVKREYTPPKDKQLQLTEVTTFVADGHLGKLSRNLRLLGFDVAYDPQADDRQLLGFMKAENRALLTRDRRLLMHSVVTTGYFPRSQDPGEQTIEVVRRFDLLGFIAPFTRCLRCNARLEAVRKSDVVDTLEPLTKMYYEEFRRCSGCGHVYWPGSHFAKLQERLEQICAGVSASRLAVFL